MHVRVTSLAQSMPSFAGLDGLFHCYRADSASVHTATGMGIGLHHGLS